MLNGLFHRLPKQQEAAWCAFCRLNRMLLGGLCWLQSSFPSIAIVAVVFFQTARSASSSNKLLFDLYAHCVHAHPKTCISVC